MRGILRIKFGFTIIEIIIVIVLVSIFSYGISLFVVQTVDSWRFLTQRYNMEQNGKLAIDFLTRDLRQMDIDDAGNPMISLATPTSILFTNSDGENIRYDFSGDTIYKNNRPLIKDIGEFEIRYFRKDNSELNPGPGGLTQAQIRQLWYLYVRFLVTREDQTLEYSSYVFPRNFLVR